MRTGIEVRRAADRPVTYAEGRSTAHSFSFGAHYDPDNVGLGLLVAHNDERLPAGGGYSDHPHRDTEIVTVVLEGVLHHRSDAGSGELGVGGVQVLSAGRGVVHSETATHDGPVRFVQTWLRPDGDDLVPAYACADALAAGDTEGLVPLVGGDGPLGLANGARLFVAVVQPGGELALPDHPLLHVFVTDGELLLHGQSLGPDDAGRVRGLGRSTLGAPRGGRALVWALPPD